MHISFFCIFSTVLLYAVMPLYTGESSRAEYLELIQRHPNIVRSLGDASQGEIEIILDQDAMAEVEKKTGVEVGVIQHSKWGWLWLNEACQFPSGHQAVFGRILLAKSLDSSPGVAVMPMTEEGKVILLCNYRHATRSWEIELPRGMVERGESAQAAAHREALEETGMEVADLQFLGEIPPDSGLTSTIAPIYWARVVGKQKTKHDAEEVIEEILSLTIEEMKQAFLQGSYECTIRGVKKQVPFRDPFLAYALLMYELRELLPRK